MRTRSTTWSTSATNLAALVRSGLGGPIAELRPDEINSVVREGYFFPVVVSSVAAVLVERALEQVTGR